MKTKFNSVRLLFATALLGALASFTYAASSPQQWTTFREDSQFKKLKAGEKVVYVCNECKTVSEIEITSPAMAMELCKEGATVACPSCKKVSRIVPKRKRNDPAGGTVEVSYVNDKGEECAFIAKVADKK